MHRDHLPRVHPLLRVPHAPHGTHRGEGFRIEDQRHIAQLVEPHAVLAGDRASHGDARLMISALAVSTLALSPGTRPSKEMFGCRLPSPAWNTLLTVS